MKLVWGADQLGEVNGTQIAPYHQPSPSSSTSSGVTPAAIAAHSTQERDSARIARPGDRHRFEVMPGVPQERRQQAGPVAGRRRVRRHRLPVEPGATRRPRLRRIDFDLRPLVGHEHAADGWRGAARAGCAGGGPAPVRQPGDHTGPMRLLFGGVQLGVRNAARLSPARSLLRNKADLGYGFRWAVDVDAYLVLADANADTTAQMAAVETALAAASGDLKFLYDDDTDTRHAWLSATTFTGVRCTALTWTAAPGAQFRTWRSFTCRFEWEEIFSLSAGFLLDFTEKVRIRGGVPAFVVNEFVNNVPPQKRGTVDRTKWSATQAGRAAGLSQYPVPALFAPLWAGDLQDQDVERTTPERKGDPARHRGYEVSWTYSFEAAAPLVGLPALWT